jgi:hypothetical protein
MFTLLVLISSLLAHSTDMRNLREKTYTRDNTFCKIGDQRIQIQIRSLSSKTDQGEAKYGEYVFYYPKETPELLPLNQDHLNNFQLFHGKSSLCSKSLGYKISKDLMAVLFLKENGVDPDKLTIQLFNSKSLAPTSVIETEFVTSEAQETKDGFIFKTYNPLHRVEMGKIKIADQSFTYQDRSFYYWISYNQKGFEINPEKTFQDSDIKDFFNTQSDFEKALGWDKKEKTFKNTNLYLAVNHEQKKQCVFLSEKKLTPTGSEPEWICR